MEVSYTSDKYDPAMPYNRYVRKDWNGVYYWCEVSVSHDRRDHRQGVVAETELPEDVREKAYALCGYFPSYVDWPK